MSRARFNALSLSWRWLRRDLAAGELTVMALALIIAIMAMSSVGFFTDRVRLALAQEADQLLAADLVLNSDHRVDQALVDAARQRGLNIGHTATFPSMAQTPERSQLVTLKAVSASYPLRGQVKLFTGQGESPVQGGPAAGEAWADQRLYDALKLAPGAEIRLGDKAFRLTGTVAREPDGAMDIYNFIPRVLFNDADLAETGLVQVGSRVRYRLLMAGERPAVEAMRDWLKPRLERGQRLEDIREGRPEVRVSLERAERFLRLSALVSVFLAAAAIALAARRYVERHLDAVALLRTLGMSQSDIVRLFSLQYAGLALVSVTVGLLLGWLAQFALASVLAGLFDTALPAASWRPALAGAAVGITLLFGFCLPPLLRLRQVSPLRVLRRDSIPAGNAWLATLAGTLALVGLIVWQAGDTKLALLALVGLAATLGLAAALAWALVWLLPRLPLNVGVGWRFGLRNVARRRGLSVAQIVALSLGLMALMLLTVVRNDLLTAWDKSVPAEAPNRFIINIQPEQREPLAQAFAQAQLASPTFAPMVRARLVAINDKPMRPEQYDDERTKRLAEREFNLSWGETLRADNKLVAGNALNDEKPGWSVEEGIAKSLGLQVGDSLTYEITGTRYTAPIISLRKVDWDSFRVNFFVVGNRALLEKQPASYVASFYLPPTKNAFSDRLSKEFVNLTVIDVSVILKEVRAILSKAVAAVEVVFAFSVLAGIVVLYAATLATHDERRRETAILRTLGAHRRVVRQAATAELFLLGGLSGLIAACAALAIGAAAATYLFNLPSQPSWWLPPVAAVVGALVARLAAAPLLRRVLATPPMRALR